jgi:DNA segregation ATPase FtsK/SpoIIIE, S-DNA-T family
VTPFAGQTVTEYIKQADAFALAFHVPFVTFGITANGLISIRAGQVPVPDAYDHPGQLEPHGDDTNMRLLPQVSAAPDQWSNMPELSTRIDERELLQHVPMARDLDGHAWHMPIEGQHVFIAARTGGGKGSWIWSLVLGLAPAWRAGLVTFFGCDPKRLELAIGRDYWEQYADSGEAIVALLEQCVHAMHERADSLQGKVRKFTPSQETPLVVIVVDELGYITSMMPDKKLRARAEDAIVTLLSQGRAVGYAVVAAVQDPRKETVNFRDLFPIRIAGGLPEPMVDLVLGDGAHDAGALCEQIPLGNAGAGVGYVISETSLKPLCVRAAWCGDDAIKRALARNRP